jgi:mRNA interferase MazF
MGTFIKGDVIVASLNYSNLSGGKRRPALVVAAPMGLDPVLCLITSKSRGDDYDVSITKADFISGGLSIDSNVRACHMFTLDPKIIDYQAGALKPEKVNEVISKIIKMLNK